MNAIRPICLLVCGIGLSFTCNFAIASIVFTRQEVDADIVWQITAGTSVAATVLGSLPVFGGMALVASSVRRRTSWESETKCLYRWLLICFLLTAICVFIPTDSDFVRAKFSLLRVSFSLEIAVVSGVLCCLISLNLLLRRLGFQRDRFEADNLNRDDEPAS